MRKIRGSVILLAALFLAGIFLIAYPLYSDYWNARHQTMAIASYTESVEKASEKVDEQLLKAAEVYNSKLCEKNNRWKMTEAEKKEYQGLLTIEEAGEAKSKPMGILEIPRIQCHLPIYHGTDEAVLQVAVGHLEGSSLPVGGPGTHAVISGHRGLPSATLFTNLDELVEGDIFIIKVCNRILTYEVDQIRIVEPEDVGDLEIEKDKDYCTLLTCTPYGINTHRLLVRGQRIDNLTSDQMILSADGVRVNRKKAAIGAAIPVWLFCMLINLGKKRIERRKDG